MFPVRMPHDGRLGVGGRVITTRQTHREVNGGKQRVVAEGEMDAWLLADKI
jgi:hypothetical protein